MARAGAARGEIQMTEGSLWKNILLFSIPLVFSQLLQVMFNMADVAVVGKFASDTALGSVGSTSTLVTLFTGFLIGMGNGVNVRVAQHLGAQHREETSRAVHTAFLLCLLAGVGIMALCLALAANMLEMLHTKDDLLPGAVLYFRIYALGMPALGIFNFGNAVLSANGDTKRPLLYLTIAGILNVILNLFFVIVCKMAADGVALASVISQYVSAILVVWHMMRLNDACKFYFQRLRFHGDEVGRTSGARRPGRHPAHDFCDCEPVHSGGGGNSFDSTMVSGNAAAANTDTIIYNIMMAFYTACSTFMGQNWGAGHKKRMMDSYLISLFYAFAVAAVLGVAFYFAGRPFLYVFTNSADVVEAGMQRMKIMCFSYAISAFMDNTIGGLPRPRADDRADGGRHHGFLRVPRHLGVYHLRALSHDPLALSALRLLVDDHGGGRDASISCTASGSSRLVPETA